MPEEKISELYKDVKSEDQELMKGLVNDIQRGMPFKEMYNLYPELSYEVKNFVNSKYGKSFSEAI